MLAAAALAAGCASTSVTLAPSPQSAVCERTATALVLWAPQWRPDQKDALDREAAAAAGLLGFLERSGCFARWKLQRVPDVNAATVEAQAAAAGGSFDKVVALGLRELGPVVKLLSSTALVDGGTEVLLHVAVWAPPQAGGPRRFTVHWWHGGPGVVKGVSGLPSDLKAALQAGLQPGATP